MKEQVGALTGSRRRAGGLRYLAEFDTLKNRANIEYDSLLAGSRYYLGETYFLEDRFEEAATQCATVIGTFRAYQTESLDHFGQSKHYSQDYAGALAVFPRSNVADGVFAHDGGDLAARRGLSMRVVGVHRGWRHEA